jgi:hypothetical protein
MEVVDALYGLVRVPRHLQKESVNEDETIDTLMKPLMKPFQP